MYDDAEAIGNWRYAGTQERNVYITELAVPWSDLQSYTAGMPAIAEGLKFRFTPIIPKVASEDHFGPDWNQINMHDRFGRPEAVTDENDNPGELPVNWAGFILVAATYTPPAAEEEAPEAAAETAPAVSTPAPQTGDLTLYIIITLFIFAGVSIILFAKSNRKTI
jgi:hypothetical protein